MIEDFDYALREKRADKAWPGSGRGPRAERASESAGNHSHAGGSSIATRPCQGKNINCESTGLGRWKDCEKKTWKSWLNFGRRTRSTRESEDSLRVVCTWRQPCW